MNNDFPNFKKDIDQIEIPEKKLNLAVESAIKQGKRKKWSLGKKITYLCSAAVIFISLLMGSTFVSPIMAKVMSNVPLLNQILQSMDQTEDRKEMLNEFYSKVSETLNKNYEGVVSVSLSRMFTYDPPEINIGAENKTFEQDYGEEIKRVINDLADSFHIDEVKISIEVQNNDFADISKEDKEEMELSEQLFNIAEEVLQQKGYKLGMMSVDAENPILQIEVRDTQQQFNKEKDDVESLVHDAIYNKTDLEYEVEITGRSEAEIRDQNWQPIFSSVMDEVNKQYSEMNGFAYSFHPEPLQIILKTSLSDGEQAKKLAEEIAKYAREVIEVKRDTLTVEKIPYKIMIRNKEQDNLYEILYK
ncbi:DUF4179 domain-containing protein [Gracilibacillus caseinilyticus]|uniref:DUF4179 domain-containing protein n=1 Tax=Gracilibacillus caseinilyticus TaxID=2932256 RepID=A0ABY4EWG1_9BACI|nr:DUF4179 domain-containing protein [Gracilibacillus caseinilyticus]UOQ48757.1 DUF4179 domain-containing protein [Gracilibacillus caseinilyticus]